MARLELPDMSMLDGEFKRVTVLRACPWWPRGPYPSQAEPPMRWAVHKACPLDEPPYNGLGKWHMPAKLLESEDRLCGAPGIWNLTRPRSF